MLEVDRHVPSEVRVRLIETPGRPDDADAPPTPDDADDPRETEGADR